MKSTKQTRKDLRKRRVRARISGTAARPRLSVFRGIKTVSAQLIDDEAGRTLASATERELRLQGSGVTKTERASALGALIARKAKDKGISSVVFDRGGNAYHGRVRALAEAAREGGLEF